MRQHYRGHVLESETGQAGWGQWPGGLRWQRPDLLGGVRGRSPGFHATHEEKWLRGSKQTNDTLWFTCLKKCPLGTAGPEHLALECSIKRSKHQNKKVLRANPHPVTPVPLAHGGWWPLLLTRRLTYYKVGTNLFACLTSTRIRLTAVQRSLPSELHTEPASWLWVQWYPLITGKKKKS